MSGEAKKILAPQLNVNDEIVDLVKWHVEHGGVVSICDMICEIETVKSVNEMVAEDNGVIYLKVRSGTSMKVGECLGYIGDSLESIETFIEKNAKKTENVSSEKVKSLKITQKAKKLIKKHQLDVNEILKMGVKGTIKESDVEQFLNMTKPQLSTPKKDIELPGAYTEYVEEDGLHEGHSLFISQKLKNSVDNKLMTTIETELDITEIKRLTEEFKEKNIMLSYLHVLLFSASRILPKFPLFMKFRLGNKIYRYKSVNIAFIVKTFDELLYSPVLREADKHSIEDLVMNCHVTTLKANRQQLQHDEMEGACFTVSYIPNADIRRFVAIIDQFQSGILAVSGEHSRLAIKDGKVCEVPVLTLTLSYDHQIIDGWYAGSFLSQLQKEIKKVVKG